MSNIPPPVCELVRESTEYGRVVLREINYELQHSKTLTLTFDSFTKGKFQLVFDSPAAVRVMDEGQLCEFWTNYSMRNGWLWQVASGGWLDLECTRPRFWLKDVSNGKLREYMIANDQCVFVLTSIAPKFVAIKTDASKTDL